jgi:hypothetical protein
VGPRPALRHRVTGADPLARYAARCAMPAVPEDIGAAMVIGP